MPMQVYVFYTCYAESPAIIASAFHLYGVFLPSLTHDAWHWVSIALINYFIIQTLHAPLFLNRFPVIWSYHYTYMRMYKAWFPWSPFWSVSIIIVGTGAYLSHWLQENEADCWVVQGCTICQHGAHQWFDCSTKFIWILWHTHTHTHIWWFCLCFIHNRPLILEYGLWDKVRVDQDQ